jgi:hypothetical protein
MVFGEQPPGETLFVSENELNKHRLRVVVIDSTVTVPVREYLSTNSFRSLVGITVACYYLAFTINLILMVFPSTVYYRYLYSSYGTARCHETL